jgi:hypothetical protein
MSAHVFLQPRNTFMLNTLKQDIRPMVGTDTSVFTWTEVMEIDLEACVRAIASATNLNFSNILENVPDIVGLHLLRKMECDLGSVSKAAVRIGFEFDFTLYRMEISRNGETVMMVTMPGNKTLPAIEARASALQNFLTKLVGQVDLSHAKWTYSHDKAAGERRGSEWISKRLGTEPMNAQERARYKGFVPGRQVSSNLADNPFQTVVATLSRDLG